MHRANSGSILVVAVGMFAVIVSSFVQAADEPKSDTVTKVPLGLDPLPIPADNPQTAAKIELGKQLYFDPRLSYDGTISCATCHDPAKGWSNGDTFGVGIKGQKGGRNSPTVINAAYFPLQFWDGRAKELEGPALGQIQNPIDMGNTLDACVE